MNHLGIKLGFLKSSVVFYISVRSSDPTPGLFTISDPELQDIVKLFMKVVFKRLIKTNVTDLPGVSSSCYRDFLLVCQHQSPYSHCRVCSACETESENQKRTNLGFWSSQRNQRI